MLVVKRDKTETQWNFKKVYDSIFAAFKATGLDENSNCGSSSYPVTTLCHLMAENIEATYDESSRVSVEDILDSIRDTLMANGHYAQAEAFIIYRNNRTNARGNHHGLLDVVKFVDEYIGDMDWRASENANSPKSFPSLILRAAEEVVSRYSLVKMPKRTANAHDNGFIHFHDLGFGIAGYCAGWSTRDLLLEGIDIKPGCIAGPSKHFDTACVQIPNFLGTAQNEYAGAQALNNVDTYLAPLIRLDNLSYADVKQTLQKLIFNLNTTSRWGGQCPFTNITLDLTCPKYMENEPIIAGGKLHDTLTYGDFQHEMDMFNKAFVEVMAAGDYKGYPFSFPIPTYHITEKTMWKSEIMIDIMKLTGTFGTPYFQNFVNSDLNPEDVRSMCCRLSMDLREVRKKTGGLFGAGDLTGSIGVVTLNLPKLAYLANGDENKLFENIDEQLENAREGLEWRRRRVTTLLETGMLPLSKKYLKNGFKAHFSTIGVCGMNEACINLYGKDVSQDIRSEKGLDLAKRIMNHINERCIAFQEETGHLYNFEATPAEGAGYRLARCDREAYGEDIYQSGNDVGYYTGSAMLPADATCDPFLAAEHQNQLLPIFSGGSVLHFKFGEAIKDPETVKQFLIDVVTKTRIPYISITPSFNICPNCGMSSGKDAVCPKCGAPTLVYDRVVGYYRPVQVWNAGKKEEYKQQVHFDNKLINGPDIYIDEEVKG